MKAKSLDLQSLLIPEVQLFLKEAGVKVDLRLSDAVGRSPNEELLDAVHEAIQSYSQRRDHERRLGELGELGAGVTHEARNVITGVLGLAQLALAQTKAARESVQPANWEDRPDLRGPLGTIAQESQRCVELLSNYLSFASKREPSAQVVSMRSLIDPVIQLTAHAAKVRRCLIDVQITPDLPAIVVRAAELREVLLNLVINALHAANKDGRIQIVADRADKEFLRIRVIDNGPGVPDAIKERVFEQFFSTKPAGVGTGLGLALARRVIEGHGGSLDVQDAPRGGAEFVIRLPIDQDVFSISERAPAKK